MDQLRGFLTKRNIVSLLIVAILLAAVSAGVYLSQQRQIFRPKASQFTAQPVDFYGTQIQVLQLFGQNSFKENSRNIVNGRGIYHAAGVLVDRSSNPNKVYVVDSGNNRILGFNGAGHCSAVPLSSCTTDSDCPGLLGGTCVVDGSKDPDIVFGQDNFEEASCNRDNNQGIYKSPSANSLCMVGFPFTTNISETWTFYNNAIDVEGNLYVSDAWNDRILKYNQPFSTDHTDGKGDTVADFVIGQQDFNRNGRNSSTNANFFATPLAPTAQSLNISFGPHGATTRGGVSVDTQGNIWVADTYNHRVLRFPANSPTADLVLGQTDFTSAAESSTCYNNNYQTPDSLPKNTLCQPTLAKIDPDTGNLYVLDEFGDPFRARILIFEKPSQGGFVNGMAAARVLYSLQGPPPATYGPPVPYFFQASGFEFNSYRQGEYSVGKLWVNEHQTFRTALIDDNGNVVKAIGAPDTTTLGGDYLYAGCGSIYDNFNLWMPGGSIGFDSSNNIYLADRRFHRISRYTLPYNPRTVNGRVCLPPPSGGLFPGTFPNVSVLDPQEPSVTSNNKLGEAVGLAVAGSQLIVQDEARLKIWNNYQTKPNSSVPDIVIKGGLPNRTLLSNSIDDSNRLWVTNESGGIRIYQLPFRGDDIPIADNLQLYWSDDSNGSPISSYGIGYAFDKTNKRMYVVDSRNNRVLRLSDHNSFGTKLLVDMVLGQPDKAHTLCNGNEPGDPGANPRADTMCAPYQAKFDNLGNLYVVENNYECHGNDRITAFTSSNLASATGLFPGLPARIVYVADSFTSKGPCGYNVTDRPGSPVSIAFNSRNQMVVGNDGYFGDINQRHLKQLWVYDNPITKQTPDGTIRLPMGAPGEMVVDSQDNLIVQDHTWSKVWIIHPGVDTSWLVSSTQGVLAWPFSHSSPEPSPSVSPTPSLQPSPTPSPPQNPNCMPGDFDGNRCVDINDFGFWKTQFLNNEMVCSGNRKTSVYDFAVWLSEFEGVRNICP